MVNNLVFDRNNDRIVEINGFEMIVHDNHRPNRRNVICHSNQLEKYIISNNLHKINQQDAILISDYLYKNRFIDINVIGAKGYY